MHNQPHTQKSDWLIPVDQYVTSLQKKVDDAYWDGDTDINLPFIIQELKHFLKLQENGVAYEPTF